MKKIITLLILVCCAITASAQQPNGSARPAATAQPVSAAYSNSTINYIRTFEPAIPISDPAAVIANTNLRQVKQNSQYFDGLGRPLQTVSKGMGKNGKDIVAPVIYDQFGRETLKYLPYVSPGSDGKFKLNPFGEQSQFMSGYQPGENIYYGETEFETSPLSRVMKSYAPGNSWSRTGGNRPVTNEYLVNTVADSVKIWDMPITATLPTRTGDYAAGELYKNVVKDEHGKSVVEFKDKQDRVVLKKVQLLGTATGGHNGWLSTYYIYDDLNNLRFVLPPKAVDALAGNNWQFATGMADELCFQYKYDARRRMTEKRVPGVKAVTEMVYDVRDRLVFSRDANLAASNRWMVTFYDGLNRPTMTAFYNSADTRATLQTGMDGTVTNTTNIDYSFPNPEILTVSEHDGRPRYQASRYVDWETGFEAEGETVAENVPGGKVGTTTLTVSNPLPNLDKSKLYTLTYMFYDKYDYVGAHALRTSDLSKPQSTDPAKEPATAASTLTRDLVTGIKVRVLGTEQWLTTTTYYDDRSRAIQVIADNVNGNQDVISTLYDFSGKVLSTYQYHNNAKSTATTTTRLLTQLIYDDAGRLTTVRKQVNDQPLKTIATHDYDALGQLKTKVLGNNLETLDYTYNIRGWLKSINKDFVDEKTQRFFGTELHYDYGYSANQFNGNIAGITWRGSNDQQIRSYGYNYDATNRLLKADFRQKSGQTWVNNTVNFSVNMGNGVDPLTAYDANGNIKAITQYGLKGTSSSMVDQLTYQYFANSNKLQGVKDAVNDPTSALGDFKEINGQGTNDYDYDNNGNLTQDHNKGIGVKGITYNHLNLPEQIVIANKGTISYQYDATGNKLRKTVIDRTVNPAKTTITDYAGGFVYQNDTLQFFSHEEGRVRWVAKTGQPGVPMFDYFVKDHLGNVRLVLTEQTDFSMYMATMETASAAKEQALFSNVEETRSPKPVGYPAASQEADKNEFTAKLNAKSGGKKIGPSLVLKVMAGDTVQIGAQAFYKSQGPADNKQAAPVEDMIADLAAAFSTGTSESSSHGATRQSSNSPFTSNFYSNDYQRLEQKDPEQNRSDKPKAYLNFVLFDEQFNLVENNSGVKQVKGEPDQLQTLAQDKTVMTKSGYLYVYTSNESQQDVFFDNVTVGVNAGPVLEETHYYPFGLTMSGISYNAMKGAKYPENRLKYNSKELQKDEFGDGSGLEWYDYGARMYDVQIGRWDVIDPLSSQYSNISTYSYTANNPIRFIDPDGRMTIDIMPPDDYIFNENGDYVRTDKTNKPDRLVIENSKTGATQLYQFADPDADPKAIAGGTINKVVLVSVAKAADIMGKAGAFDAINRKNEWSYMNTESKGGGELDFSYSAIPKQFPGASKDPLTTPSPMLFIPEGDGYAHNHMNFGNFLWGASGHSLGFSETTLKTAAHYNSVMNPGTNGYDRQLDSKDDQRSISRGVNFSKTNQFRQRTWTPTGGLSTPPTKKR